MSWFSPLAVLLVFGFTKLTIRTLPRYSYDKNHIFCIFFMYIHMKKSPFVAESWFIGRESIYQDITRFLCFAIFQFDIVKTFMIDF